MSFLVNWQRNRAVKSYMKKMPALLQSRYGYSKHYTQAQVEKTVADCSLNSVYLEYAIALFTEAPSVNGNDAESRLVSIRDYLAKNYFGGNSGYSVVDVTVVAASGWLAESGIVDVIANGGTEDGGGFGDGGGGDG